MVMSPTIGTKHNVQPLASSISIYATHERELGRRLDGVAWHGGNTRM